MSNLRKSLFWLLYGLLFLIPSNVFAGGVNVEDRRSRIEKNGAFGDVQMQGAIQQGNTNLVNLGASGLIGYRKGRHTIFGFGNFSFTSESLFKKKNIQNSEMGHVRYNVRIKNWVLWEVFSQAQADQNIFVDLRYLLGTGPRFVPLRRGGNLIVLGTAYMPEYEILNRDVQRPFPSGLGYRKTWVHRWSSYVSYRADITDQFIFQTTAYVQPRFDRFSDVKAFNDNVLTMQINNLLDFNVSLGVGFDKEPPTICDGDECRKLKKLDFGTQMGIKVRF